MFLPSAYSVKRTTAERVIVGLLLYRAMVLSFQNIFQAGLFAEDLSFSMYWANNLCLLPPIGLDPAST